MKNLLRLAPVLLAAAFLAGCEGPCQKLSPITAPATSLSSGTADFTTFVAVGTSISSGYQSGGLMDRHQVNAYPAIFARQIGKTVLLNGQGSFAQPTVGGNGTAGMLHVTSFSPLTIVPYDTPGSPTNLTWPSPYNDMAVPGALIYDFANTTNYGGAAFQLVARGTTSIQTQMLALHPTFISFEYGANEVLGPASSGSAVAPTGVPAANWNAIASPTPYAGLMAAAFAAIHAAAPAAKMVVGNAPDVRSIPFFTTLSPIAHAAAGGYLPLHGYKHVAHGAAMVLRDTLLAPTDLVTLKAQGVLAAGTGFLAGSINYLTGTTVSASGAALDSVYILDTAEQAVLAAKISAMNTSVANLVAANSWTAAFDVHGLLATIAANGLFAGGTHYTAAFVTGGLFTLDGVHPSDMGHAYAANGMIDAVNAKWGANVPHANYLDYANASFSSAHPALPQDMVNGMRLQGLGESLDALFRR